jgi:ERCC4-related helicase
VKLLNRRAKTISQELGSWAVKFYLRQTLLALRRSQVSGTLVQNWDYLKPQILDQLHRHISVDEVSQVDDLSMEVSPKVARLIQNLKKQDNETVGVIFVEQRVTVGVLSELLARHPDTKHRFQNATFVGQPQQYNLDELLDIKNQDQALEDFRKGRKNLIIATDVLEEGIDVSACNLVICFDPPKHMKSFIQRRGRARHKKSEYVILLPKVEQDPTGQIIVEPAHKKLRKWISGEAELIRNYQDSTRVLDENARLEEDDEIVDYELHISSSG